MPVFDFNQQQSTATSTATNATKTEQTNYFTNDFGLDKASRIEAEYNSYDQTIAENNAKLKEVREFNESTFGEYKKVSDDKKKLQKLRWHLVLFNYIFISLCLFGFCIYNIVEISQLNYKIKIKRSNDNQTNASIVYHMDEGVPSLDELIPLE